MSNVPLRHPINRWDVQFIVEIPNSPTRRPTYRGHIKLQRKSRDSIYLECPNDRYDELEKCNKETGKTKCDRIIRHPHGRTIRPMRPDDPMPEKEGSDYCLEHSSERMFSQGWKLPSRPDDPSWGIWSVGVMVGSMIRDVVLEFKSSLQHWMIRRGIQIASD